MVVLKYDGNRFYWEIMVNSRDDSVKPKDELIDNDYIERFDLGWNQRRIFAWDGSKYINYFRPGNQAIIESQRGNVNGPLTAGIITWGYGKYNYKNLLQEYLILKYTREEYSPVRRNVQHALCRFEFFRLELPACANYYEIYCSGQLDFSGL